MPPEEREAEGVRDEGKRADCRHGGGDGRHPGTKAEGSLQQNTDTEGSHDPALDQSSASAPHEAPVENEETESVDKGVTKHVQGVGEERAELARLRGDETVRTREQRNALRLYTEMRATGHAERLARELGSS